MLNDKVSHDPKHDHDQPKSLYPRIISLLPLAVRTNNITEASKHSLLGRVFIHDHDALMRFFITIIRSPECAEYVEELYCHVDLKKHTSAKRLARDIAMLDSIFPRLRSCPKSRDLVACMHKYTLRGGGEKQRYNLAADNRFRQAVLLSLLGHLRPLTFVDLTISREGEGCLSWFRRQIRRNSFGGGDGIPSAGRCCPSLREVMLDRRGGPPKLGPRRRGWRWG